VATANARGSFDDVGIRPGVATWFDFEPGAERLPPHPRFVAARRSATIRRRREEREKVLEPFREPRARDLLGGGDVDDRGLNVRDEARDVGRAP
jgi:hypothetical protein